MTGESFFMPPHHISHRQLPTRNQKKITKGSLQKREKQTRNPEKPAKKATNTSEKH
jgi:hypothetical protein